MYCEAKKKYSIKTTYQAYYKTLKKLLDYGILVRKNKEYEISTSWLSEVKNFCDKIENRYFKEPTISLTFNSIQKKEGVYAISFENLMERDKYILDLENKWVRHMGKKILWAYKYNTAGGR